MKKSLFLLFGTILVVGSIILMIVYLPKFTAFINGVKPLITPSPVSITSPSFNATGLPLQVPAGFLIALFAKDLPDARVMAFDPQGRMLVSETSAGKVVALAGQADGLAAHAGTVVQGLRDPHGLAFDCPDPVSAQTCKLYVAATDQIVRYDYDPANASAGNAQKIADLPSGAGHFTRTIAFGPDERLYVSIGSSCNVCIEKDGRRASIYSMNKDGSDFRLYASGLRNTVFFTWSPVDGQMWGADMGRDYLGDDLPPDEINLLKNGGNYGWPICYGKDIHDTNFDKNLYIQNPCAGKAASFVDLPAHSAPLGLAFVPSNSPWPAEYWGDLLVAYHGSWNRTVPTGYKIVRISSLDQGAKLDTEDFISGWLTKAGTLGRPVDLVFDSKGTMYISDDQAGVIYQVTYGGTAAEDFIHVAAPAAGSLVRSPLTVSGQARGNWFFEASFPVKLLDGNHQIVASGTAQAQGDWMTNEFVPFTASLNFVAPFTPTGMLVLEKDNPSGLTDNAASLSIPIRFVSQ